MDFHNTFDSVKKLGHISVQLIVKLQTLGGLVQEILVGMVGRHQLAQRLLPLSQDTVHLEPSVCVLSVPLRHRLDYRGLGRDVLSDVADYFVMLLQFLFKYFLCLIVPLHSYSAGYIILLNCIPQLLLEMVPLIPHFVNFLHNFPHILQTIQSFIIKLG